jgi:hypothetical protein
MEILLAALAAAGAVGILGWSSRSSLALGRQRQLRRSVVVLLVVLPFVFGLVVLNRARERTRVLQFDYVGKRLAFGPGAPLTAGGSPEDSLEVEDLQAPLLGRRSVLLEPGAPAPVPTDSSAGVGPGSPASALLELGSPSPAVRVDDRYLNSYPLMDGDVIVVAKLGAQPVRITYRDDRLSWSSGTRDLPSSFLHALSAGNRVYELAELYPQLVGITSFLHSPERFGPWHLVIRSQEVHLERGGMTAGAFIPRWGVPADFELGLDVVLGRVLRNQRRDRIIIRRSEIEIHFDKPYRWVRPVAQGSKEVILALGVPSAFAREEMVELPEPSSRFRGLMALYRYDRNKDNATITLLGDKQVVHSGRLYALGAGKDRMLVRLESRDLPKELLLDLALLSLFFAIFLGRGMTAHTGLAAVVGSVGLLLAQRLLFSYKAANQAPYFATDVFEGARVALWIVPALLVFAWALAWILRQPADRVPVGEPLPPRGPQIADLGWPLGGLAIAATGILFATPGAAASRRLLALLPALLGAVLVLARTQSRRPQIASALGALQRDGFPWRPGWIAVVGAAVLGVRWGALKLGMPEAFRLPFFEFRVLWTVFQLPVCAAAVGLTLESLARRERQREDGDPERTEVGSSRRLLRHPGDWPRLSATMSKLSRGPILGIAAFYTFIFLAFLVAAALVGDMGLVLVHGLAPMVALLVLAALRPVRSVHILAILPLVAVIAVNAFPSAVVRIVGWGPAGAEQDASRGAPVRERATQLSSTRAQQMFRLYLLANPSVLSEVGLEPAERVAIQYSTMQSYAKLGGRFGKGFLAAEIPRNLGRTYLSDLVPMVFVLTEFGIVGLFGLSILYLLPLSAVSLTAREHKEGDRLGQQGLYVGLAALLAVALPSLYMLLANLNLVLFTGKNTSLLALNSLSDLLESGTLLGLAVVGLGVRRGAV